MSSIALVDELETAFHACLAATSNAEHFSQRDVDEVKVGVEQTVQKFLDTARQMECFFLQKRLVVSPQKPDQVIMEDNMELKNELARKEQLLEKYHTKLLDWQRLVNDATIGGGGGGIAQSQSLQSTNSQSSAMIQQSRSPMGVAGPHMGVGGGGGVMPVSGASQPGILPSQIQPTQLQHPSNMIGGQQMIGGNQVSVGGGQLPGPLAYLERTTSNIGITDTRR